MWEHNFTRGRSKWFRKTGRHSRLFLKAAKPPRSPTFLQRRSRDNTGQHYTFHITSWIIQRLRTSLLSELDRTSLTEQLTKSHFKVIYKENTGSVRVDVADSAVHFQMDETDPSHHYVVNISVSPPERIFCRPAIPSVTFVQETILRVNFFWQWSEGYKAGTHPLFLHSRI